MVLRLELLVAAFAAGGFLLGGTAHAQDIHRAVNSSCAELAQNPLDGETAAGEGVDLGKMDTEAAIEACRTAVEAQPDDARTVYHLGRAYDAAGQYDLALSQYEAAAEMGSLIAINALGSLYEAGLGVDVDAAKAVEYYVQAAEGGLVVGIENLALAYENGRGVTQDYEKAAELYREAIDAGSTWAAGTLGWLTENGFGVDQDEVEAARLYRIAADAGHAFAQHNLGWMYSNGMGGLEASDTKALEYYRRAAKQGWARSLLNIAWHYSNARGVERDPAMAEDYYRRTLAVPDIEDGVKADALNNLAWLFAEENTNLEEAETLSRESLAIEPDDGNHIDTLAWILHLNGRSDEALPLIRQALASAPDNAEFIQHFAAIKAALK